MIVFRADGNPDIGAGHIMRCLSIADAALRFGDRCHFVVSSDDFAELIVSRGNEVTVLGTDYRDMMGGISEMTDILTREEPTDVIADSYQVTTEYLESLKDFCYCVGAKLVYIDDVLSFAYPCDVLINYGIVDVAEAYERLYEGCGMPRLLLGVDYAPLREEFWLIGSRLINDDARDIFVSTGGADTEHMAVSFLREALMHEDYRFHFVIGAMNPDGEEIDQQCHGHSNIRIYDNVKRMADLMLTCDVAISASGSTLFELAATGTPTLAYVVADNQIPGAMGFSEAGLMEDLGDVRKTEREDFCRDAIGRAIELCQDYQRRCAVSIRMKQTVDGEGAMRIVREIRSERN